VYASLTIAGFYRARLAGVIMIGMAAFDTFLLDVDGTLVDSNDAHAHAWAETLARHGYDVPFVRVRRMIGMGGDRIIEEVMGHSRDSHANEAISKERSRLFRDRWLREVRTLRGSRDLVLRLRDGGYRYAIASAATSSELAPLLELANVADLIEVKTTSSEVEESKPDPEIVETALGKLGGPRDRAVMVGDTPYDIEAAHAAGIACIGVTSGGWTAYELAAAISVFGGPYDLALALPDAPPYELDGP
jgi:HAD superfamily hydrolase (TIGR01509 family)